MSEGTASAYVSRWLINDAGTGILQTALGLTNTSCTYYPKNHEDYLGDDGWVEGIYWDKDVNTEVDVKAFKGGVNIKYTETTDRDLVILVAAPDQDATAEDVEERGAGLLGEVIKAVVANQPTSPGDHLLNVRCHISNWESDRGWLSRAGSKVHAITYRVEVRTQASVEQ